MKLEGFIPYILICLLTLLSITAFGQLSTVTGKIHLASGESVSHATIRVKGTDISSMSDKEGRYSLNNVPYGNREIQVTAIEIQPKTVRLKVDKPIHNFLIAVSATGDIALEGVEVSRMTEKREMETSGFAVAVIETKEASLRNLTTNELLDRAVGVRVRQNGGVGAPIEYNLNGMSGSAVGIFLDGIEVSTYGSSFNLNNIPPAMIERIEVYKGVLPSHLSGDYVGGAINVVMKKDASANNITAALSYGSFNTAQGDLSALYRNQKNGFTTRMSGFYTYTDNSYKMRGKFSKYTQPGGRVMRYYEGKRFNDSYRAAGGRFEFGFTDVDWADQFFLGYNVSDTYNEIPHGTTMARPYVGRHAEYQANAFSLNYNKRNLFVEGLALNLDAVHSRRTTYLEDTVSMRYNWDGNPLLLAPNQDGELLPEGHLSGKGQQGDAVISDIQRQITNIRSNLAYTIISGHRVAVNYKYELTDRNDKDLLNPAKDRWVTRNQVSKGIVSMNYEAQTFDGKLRTNILGKYTESRNRQTKPVDEVNGIINHEKKTTREGNFGYGATVSYNAIPNLFVIGSAENSYVAPTESQIFGDPENNLMPNMQITSEQNINYNLGLRYGTIEFGKHKLSVYGNVFWRNGYDKITLRTVVDGIIEGREQDHEDIQVTQYVNLSKTQSRGFESEIIYIYDNKLNMLFNLSKFNSLFKQELDESGKPNDFYNRQIPNEPFFTMNGSVQYRMNNIIQKQAALNVYYNMGYVAPFNTVWPESEWFVTPTQFHHDIGASYRFPSGKMVVSLDLKNILDAEVYDNFGVIKPGRGAYVKLNYTINNFNKF
ncbi:TonB-dependent receptor [Sphingobacterium chuzhouense]|uniref:TonB-dependent receptor plug domain-containing protein n=1 Tax=Sphingobacterium chuzhouense TaxID=1742264 RepID=A0ABR7XNK6_9SPHI|nr:TonB-dependent receptor plug domain-containing protein [Sphingobacterium chuzhouense]MBD1420761.1 TonB-dependent receptor plug domain-containing protein [Sphingobacterium chuzhouense]